MSFQSIRSAVQEGGCSKGQYSVEGIEVARIDLSLLYQLGGNNSTLDKGHQVAIWDALFFGEAATL